MKFKIILIVIFFLFIINCEKKSKINFIKWNEAIIEKNAVLIGQNEIAGYKTAVFQSKFLLEELKQAYIDKGYKEDSTNPYSLKKDNISISFINIDNQMTNIMIRIVPK